MTVEKIDYAFLRNIQSNEKASMELTKLPDNFYSECSVYLKMLKENQEKNPSLITLREYENARRIFEDIVNIRVKKIILNILQLSLQPDNILPEEKELYDNVKSEMMKFKKNLFSEKRDVQSNAGFQPSPHHEKKDEESFQTHQNVSNTENIGFKKVKILKDTPQYRGSDGNVYGPYKQGTSVSLPVEEAEFLISNNLAEEIE